MRRTGLPVLEISILILFFPGIEHRSLNGKYAIISIIRQIPFLKNELIQKENKNRKIMLRQSSKCRDCVLMMIIQYIGITLAWTPTSDADQKCNKIHSFGLVYRLKKVSIKNIEIKSNKQKIVPSSLQKKKTKKLEIHSSYWLFVFFSSKEKERIFIFLLSSKI